MKYHFEKFNRSKNDLNLKKTDIWIEEIKDQINIGIIFQKWKQPRFEMKSEDRKIKLNKLKIKISLRK